MWRRNVVFGISMAVLAGIALGSAFFGVILRDARSSGREVSIVNIDSLEKDAIDSLNPSVKELWLAMREKRLNAHWEEESQKLTRMARTDQKQKSVAYSFGLGGDAKVRSNERVIFVIVDQNGRIQSAGCTTPDFGDR